MKVRAKSTLETSLQETLRNWVDIEKDCIQSEYSELITCPSCSSDNRRLHFKKDGFHYDLCLDCKLVYMNPRIKTKFLKNCYRSVRKFSRKFCCTTDSNQSLPVAANILNRRFNSAAPNVAYVTDITYIRTRSGWLYLAIVLDLFSRKIVGWAMAPKMPAELVCAALRMAIQQRQPAPGLIVHSDRGSQYASDLYQALLDQHGFVCSMSRKGNCWDNAVAERFFLNLTMERVWQRDYANHAEAKIDITAYIVGFYNCERLNSVLGNLSPAIFERNMAAKKPIVVSVIS